MYSTCIFCNSPLGANEVVEHFPVGRRVAFDAEKGRLWAICPSCARWNLSPLEERWEALEECERAFRETRLRTSTDEIGMARLAEGLELVRIGRPLRPEFAAWRFGDQLGLRRRRVLRTAGAATLLTGGSAAAGMALAGTALAGPVVVVGGGFLAAWIATWREYTNIFTVSGGDGRRFALTNEHTRETTLTPPAAITRRRRRPNWSP